MNIIGSEMFELTVKASYFDKYYTLCLKLFQKIYFKDNLQVLGVYTFLCCVGCINSVEPNNIQSKGSDKYPI